MAGEKAEQRSTKGKKSLKFTLQRVFTQGQVKANFSALEEQELGRGRSWHWKQRADSRLSVMEVTMTMEKIFPLMLF